jgi:phage/plasmid-associated DNA primase
MRLTESQGYYFRYYPLPVSITQEEIDEVRKGRYDIKDNEVYKAWRNHFSNEDWGYFVNNLGTWLDYERSRLIVFIIGPTNIGKSTLLENLTRPIDPIVGRKDLKSITEDPFGLADLVGKQINVSSERVAVTLRNIEMINKLVGEKDTLDVRVKYKPATVMKSLKTMAFAMNDPPIVHEYGGGTMAAFLNRLNIIFVRAPEGFKPIKGFTVDTKEDFKFLLCCRLLYDTEGREIKKRDEEFKLEYLMEATNSALQFLKSEWVIVDPSAKVKGTTLYNAYVAYCRERGITPMSRNEFYSVVESKFSRIPMEKAHDKTTWFKGLMVDPRKMSEAEKE